MLISTSQNGGLLDHLHLPGVWRIWLLFCGSFFLLQQSFCTGRCALTRSSDSLLRDAALYITKLPKAEHEATKWQAAMEALLLIRA